MIPGTFYDNEEIRKYALLFGELFANLRIKRSNGTVEQYQRVPIAYGGREKYIARNEQDPDADKSVAVQYPRMSYELVGLQYDSSRQLNPINRKIFEKANGTISSRFVPVPWMFNFNLYITGRNVEDVSKVVQQIVPSFTPYYNIKAELIDDSCALDMQVMLQNIGIEDTYQGPISDRRIHIWTLSFVFKGWFFGAEAAPGNVIRWVNVREMSNTANNTMPVSTSNTYPTFGNTPINNILPSDPYVVKVDFTDFTK